MQSKAATVEAYLAEQPADRRAILEAVRHVVLKNLDADYDEGMLYGTIGYYVPHRVFPAGSHCDPKQPLMFAALASQKNYLSLYLMCIYTSGESDGPTEEARWFQAAVKASGKKLDMGKACIRFKKLDDLPLEVIGEAIRRVPATKYLESYTRTLDRKRVSAASKAKAGGSAKQKAARKKASKQPDR